MLSGLELYPRWVPLVCAQREFNRKLQATTKTLHLKSEFALPQTVSRLFHASCLLRQTLANIFGIEFYI